jgi:hypothetical protein
VEHRPGGAFGGGQSASTDNGREIKRREEKTEKRGPPPEL